MRSVTRSRLVLSNPTRVARFGERRCSLDALNSFEDLVHKAFIERLNYLLTVCNRLDKMVERNVERSTELQQSCKISTRKHSKIRRIPSLPAFLVRRIFLEGKRILCIRQLEPVNHSDHGMFYA